MEDGFGDWRIAAVTTITADVPAAYPGGPSHKAGTPIFLSSLVQTEDKQNIGFTLPSSTAMALNIAINAAESAKNYKAKIEYGKVVTPEGAGLSVKSQSNEDLFNYFEQCMVAVTFSFQAIEVFCNHTIARELKEAMEVKRRKQRVTLSPLELERQLSTEEKISLILPKIKGLPTPKGKKPWESFKKLKEARDSTIHMKNIDQQVVDTESLYFQFLSKDCELFPQAAVSMIHYFLNGKEPRWLQRLL
jgi:DNA-binding transcriptional regulator YhcF (GntR family)